MTSEASTPLRIAFMVMTETTQDGDHSDAARSREQFGAGQRTGNYDMGSVVTTSRWQARAAVTREVEASEGGRGSGTSRRLTGTHLTLAD
jgi:hypothetical protein